MCGFFFELSGHGSNIASVCGDFSASRKIAAPINATSSLPVSERLSLGLQRRQPILRG